MYYVGASGRKISYTKLSNKATVLIGYALESSDSQLSNAHHVIFVALLVIFFIAKKRYIFEIFITLYL